jgi:uncharacterized membrane protein YedE/YeeE
VTARLVSAVSLFLAPFLDAVAQSREAPADPPVQVNDLAITLFVLLFVGVCVGMGWMIWHNHKIEQRKEAKAKK